MCTVRQKALPSCVRSLTPPSKGELWWMNRAGENTTTPSVGDLKGALLSKQKKKVSSRHWERKATHIECIHQWSQWFSIDSPFKGKSFPFRNSLESTTGVLQVTYYRRPTSAFYEKPTREANIGMMLKYFEKPSNLSINCNFCSTKSFIASEDCASASLTCLVVIPKVAAYYLVFIMLFWKQLKCKPVSNTVRWPKVKPCFM